MEKKLLSCSRLVNMINPEFVIPQTSVTVVNVDREKIEEIRKNKGVSVRTFEKKINLSKSRYYRWLNYQIDLPVELIMGITKTLGISSIELGDLFVESTDELLQMLSLLVYVSESNEPCHFAKFLKIRKRLEKFRIATEDNLFYKLILLYSDAVASGRNGEDASYSIERIEQYFLSIDFYTLFDMVLYLAVLRFKLNQELEITFMEKQIEVFGQTILKKINAADLIEYRAVLVGGIIDIALCLEDLNLSDRARIFLKDAMSVIEENWELDAYNQTLLKLLSYLSMNQATPQRDKIIELYSERLKAAEWCLSKDEVQIFRGILNKEIPA